VSQEFEGVRIKSAHKSVFVFVICLMREIFLLLFSS